MLDVKRLRGDDVLAINPQGNLSTFCCDASGHVGDVLSTVSCDTGEIILAGGRKHERHVERIYWGPAWKLASPSEGSFHSNRPDDLLDGS